MKSTNYLLLLVISLFSFNLNGQTLKSLADAKGVYLGAIISNSLLDNNNHDAGKPSSILRSEFNIAVLENYMKMYAVMPNKPRNPFNFGVEALNTRDIDRFIKYCKTDVPTSPLRTRGHTMLWHNQVPTWLTTEAQNWTSQQIYDFTFHFIKALATHCGKNMDEWDVLNEVIAPDNFTADRRIGHFRGNTWFKNVATTQEGMDRYFKFCFETARKYAPHAKLYYNDFSMEKFNTNPDSKNARMRAFVARLVAMGAPIDVVGFQSHFTLADMATDVGANMASINSIQRSMAEIDSLGLEVAMTEVDIRKCNGLGTDVGQKAAYKEYVKMAFSQPNCNTFLTWGISDKDSWVIAQYAGCGEALLFDNSFNKKSAYTGALEALQEITAKPNPTNKISNIVVQKRVKQGEKVSVLVDYTCSESRDIVVRFQLDENPRTLFQQVVKNVNAGTGTANIEITIPTTTPIADSAYQFQVLIAPIGGGWKNRFHHSEKKDIDVAKTTSLGEADNVVALKVFPNPSHNGIFNLSESKSFQVYSLFGQLLFQQSSAIVDLTAYPSGVYILKTKGLCSRLMKID